MSRLEPVTEKRDNFGVSVTLKQGNDEYGSGLYGV